jgi:hypothetical protein
MTQIAAGVGFQFLVFRRGLWIVEMSHSDMLTDMTTLAVPLYLLALVLGLFVLSALVGGGVAGAWCVNWSLQGIAVGLGFLAAATLPIVLCVPLSLLSKMELPPLRLVVLAGWALVSVTLTTAGAMLGNLLIRPIRVPLDAVR